MSVVMSQNFICVVGRVCYQDYNPVIAGIILSFQLQHQWSIIFQRSLALAHVCTIEYTGKAPRTRTGTLLLWHEEGCYSLVRFRYGQFLVRTNRTQKQKIIRFVPSLPILLCIPTDEVFSNKGSTDLSLPFPSSAVRSAVNEAVG
jgi:hypothetical protein